MRIRAVPFSPKVGEFIKDHPQCFVVEMNRDAQLKKLLTISYPDLATNLIPAAYFDGLPLTAGKVCEMITTKAGNKR
jgi:2-oxoglutarate ferredoxin oxidoreductase subunit alpha